MKNFFWNQYAKAYDVLNDFSPYIAMQNEIIDQLQLEKGKKYRILDAGCGSGNLEIYLKLRGIEAEVTAIDYSSVMLRRAEKKFSRAGIDCQPRPCDLTQPLTFASNYFDRVVNVNVLHTLPDPGFTFGELSRVLKPEGKMIIVALKDNYQMPLILKANRHGHEPDEKWLTQSLLAWFGLVFRSFGPSLMALKFIFVAICNKIIDKEVKGLAPEFFRKMVINEGLEEAYSGFVYGGQDYLLVFKKPFFQIKIARPDEMETVRALRKEIFLKEEKLPVEREDDEYDIGAVHFLALQNGAPIGVMRLILISQKNWDFRGLHAMQIPFDFSRTLEISRFGIVKQYRNGKSFLLFLRLAYVYAKENNIEYLCGTMRVNLLRIFQRINIEFNFISEMFMYCEIWQIAAFITPVSGNYEIISQIAEARNQ